MRIFTDVTAGDCRRQGNDRWRRLGLRLDLRVDRFDNRRALVSGYLLFVQRRGDLVRLRIALAGQLPRCFILDTERQEREDAPSRDVARRVQVNAAFPVVLPLNPAQVLLYHDGKAVFPDWLEVVVSSLTGKMHDAAIGTRCN